MSLYRDDRQPIQLDFDLGGCMDTLQEGNLSFEEARNLRTLVHMQLAIEVGYVIRPYGFSAFIVFYPDGHKKWNISSDSRDSTDLFEARTMEMAVPDYTQNASSAMHLFRDVAAVLSIACVGETGTGQSRWKVGFTGEGGYRYLPDQAYPLAEAVVRAYIHATSEAQLQPGQWK